MRTERDEKKMKEHYQGMGRDGGILGVSEAVEDAGGRDAGGEHD